MKITFIVNAMLLLQGKHTKVLCDPWVTFNNQSSSDFFNFPKVNMTQAEISALNPDYIYITHTHPDHFDPITLSLFDKKIPVLVAEYENNFTARMVRQLGFKNVIIAPAGQAVSLNADDKVWIEKSAENPEVDSIGLFCLDGKYVVNVNDNVFNQAQCQSLKNIAGHIDIALVPSAAHGPWPMFFDNYSDTEKKQLAQQRAELQKQAFVNYIQALQAEYVVPIAGGIMVGGDKVDCYQFSGIRPRSEVVAYAQTQLQFKPILLSEGCSYDFEKDRQFGQYQELTYANSTEYMNELRALSNKFDKNREFYIAKSEYIDLSRLLAQARLNQFRWQERYKIKSQMVYFIDVGDDKLYRLNLADLEVYRVREADISDSEYEIFRMPYALLIGLLTRHYVWSNVNTQYMRFYRNAKQMDKGLMLLMNFLQL